MRNRVILFFVICVVFVVGLLLVRKSNAPTTVSYPSTPNPTVLDKNIKTFTIGTDICDEFTKEWIQSVIETQVIKTENFNTVTTDVCNYFVSENSFVTIHHEALNVAKQKTGLVFLDRVLKTDPRIGMDHFIAWQQNDQINNIYLVLGTDEYISVSRSSTKAIDNEKNILLAIAVADRIAGNNNPIQVKPIDKTDRATPLPQETDIINTFINLIDEGRASDAVGMMSTQITRDDSAKQAWAVNFNAIESIKVDKVISSMESDWTADRHSYQVSLNIEMKPEVAQAQPIPNYGWDTGKNTRWINLVKVGGKWYVDGIATGP